MISFSTKKGLSNITTALFEIDKFNGVDYTSTPTEIANNRAMKISNYIPKGNGLVKRYGFESYKFYELNQVNVPQEVHGIFDIKKLGANKIVFAYNALSGYLVIYRLDTTDGYLHSMSSYQVTNPVDKVNTFVVGGKMFIFTGEDLIVIDEAYMISTPLSTIVYIPKILTGIPSINSSGKALTLEQPNMLTNKVRVELNFCEQLIDEYAGTSGVYAHATYDLGKYLPNGQVCGLGTDNVRDWLEINGYNIWKTENNIYNVTDYTTNIYRPGIATAETKSDHKISVSLIKSDGSRVNVDATFRVTLNPADNQAEVLYIIDNSNSVVDLSNDTYILQDTISLTLKGFNNNSELVTKAKHIMFYGEKGNDTLFVANGNKDFHSLVPSFSATNEEWLPYTYFGSDTYQVFGQNNSEIVDYGVLSNGNMLVLKESEQGITNIYIRTKQYNNQTIDYSIQTNEGIVKYQYIKSEVLYPVSSYGINLLCDKNTKVIQYDNKTIVTAKDGIYYINPDNSTATQIYGVYELSYMIRENLSKTITKSDILEYKGYLLVLRYDVDNTPRLYVADKNRYTFVDGKMQYEWWVLDGINAEHFFILDDELYFCYLEQYTSYEQILYRKELNKFNKNNFYDDFNIAFSNSNSSLVTKSQVAFIDDTSDENIMVDYFAFDTFLNIKGDKKEYELFKENAVFTLKPKSNLNPALHFTLNINPLDYITLTATEAHYYIDKKDGVSRDFYIELVEKLVDKNYIEILDLIFEGDSTRYLIDMADGIEFADNHTFDILSTDNRLDVKIEDLYYVKYTGEGYNALATAQKYKLDDCVEYDGKWYDATTTEYLGTVDDVLFNYATFKYKDTPLKLYVAAETPDNTYIIKTFNGVIANVNYKRPIRSLWLTSYLDFDAVETLKSLTDVYFIPDIKEGGITSIAYKTSKVANDITATKFGSSELFNFNNVDFNDINFSGDKFAHTYSSRCKVKNFAYIQFKFYSDEAKVNSMARFATKYQKTKNNKGVK